MRRALLAVRGADCSHHLTRLDIQLDPVCTFHTFALHCLHILCMSVSHFRVSALQAWGQQLPKGVLSSIASMLQRNMIQFVSSSPLLAHFAFNSAVHLYEIDRNWGCHLLSLRYGVAVHVAPEVLQTFESVGAVWAQGISHPHPVVFAAARK